MQHDVSKALAGAVLAATLIAAPIAVGTAADDAGATAAAPQAPASMALPRVVTLADADIDTYLGVAEKFIEQGIDVRKQGFMDDPGALELLHSNDLSAQRMNDLSYSIAIAVARLEKSDAELDEQYRRNQEFLARMELSLADGQRSAFVEQIRLANDMIDDVRSQPEANVELVEARRPEIQAMTQRADAAAAAAAKPPEAPAS